MNGGTQVLKVFPLPETVERPGSKVIELSRHLAAFDKLNQMKVITLKDPDQK